MINKNIKRSFIVSDTHFGVNSNSIETLNLMLDYFDKDFIPNVLANVKDTDCLIHCGDVFDNRQTINLMVMSKVIELFEKLGKIFKQGIYIIAGNHDILKRNSNDITSLDCLKNIPNVFVIKDVVELEIFNTKLLLMSWRATKEDEKLTIKNSSSEYVFCHADIQSAKFDRHRIVEEGIEFADLLQIKRLFSGHIHWQQCLGNVNLVGTPYEITRSDAGNTKGFWLYDFEFDEEMFFENKFSPKYKRLNLIDIKDNLNALPEIVKNQKIDLYVDESLTDFNYSHIVEILKNNAHSVSQFKTNEIKFETTENQKSENIDLTDVAKIYLDTKKYSEHLKNYILNKFNNDILTIESNSRENI
jgi:DNA repair exonuclease SbcCD nuclease subunit